MSLTEILEELPKLTSPERDEIATRIETIRRMEDPNFLAEMDRRIDAMEAGDVIPGERVLALLRERLQKT